MKTGGQKKRTYEKTALDPCQQEKYDLKMNRKNTDYKQKELMGNNPIGNHGPHTDQYHQFHSNKQERAGGVLASKHMRGTLDETRLATKGAVPSKPNETPARLLMQHSVPEVWNSKPKVQWTQPKD